MSMVLELNGSSVGKGEVVPDAPQKFEGGFVTPNSLASQLGMTAAESKAWTDFMKESPLFLFCPFHQTKLASGQRLHLVWLTQGQVSELCFVRPLEKVPEGATYEAYAQKTGDEGVSNARLWKQRVLDVIDQYNNTGPAPRNAGLEEHAISPQKGVEILARLKQGRTGLPSKPTQPRERVLPR